MMAFKEGRMILLVLAALLATGVVFGQYIHTQTGTVIACVALAGLAFTFFFFRSPARIIPSAENAVVSPADGKIIVIEDAEENEYLNGPCTKVSIFLSVFNVHVNRNPISGTVEYQQYTPGSFAMAFADKASSQNENNAIGIAGAKCKIMFRQISGFVARRIVSHLEIGQTVTKGDIFGMIRFGSRCDMFLPKNVEVKVRLGDKVKGGESIIGEIK